jgi:CRISPR/Cas system-associated endonuclease Cas3-HD
MEVAEQTCGKKWVNTKRKKMRWWSETVREAVKRKKEAWEKYMRTRSPLDLENYRTARNGG